MKLCHFDEGRVGVVRGDLVFDVTERVEREVGPAELALSGHRLPKTLSLLQTLALAEIEASRTSSVLEVRLLSPVCFPGKIVAAPVNYKAHIQEMRASGVSPGHTIPEIGKAGLFLKASSSLVGPSQGIAQRFVDRQTDHEIELVAIMGEIARDVTPSDAPNCVAGYCLGLDVTLRGPEDRSFRKSIDSYSVLGPWLTTRDEVPAPQRLRLTLRSNGEIRQSDSTAEMILDVAQIISFASSFYTLYPGDVVFTGTPKGVGPIRPGDILVADCPELGLMTVKVRGAAR